MRIGDLVRLTMGQVPPPNPPRIGIVLSDNVEKFAGMNYCRILFEDGNTSETILKSWLTIVDSDYDLKK